MPLYEYLCRPCDRKDVQRVLFEDFDKAMYCEQCGGPMIRLISRPGRVSTPIHLRDENRLYAGLSEKEITAERKAEDEAYERSWGCKSLPSTESIRPEGPTLMDIPMEDKPADAATMAWLQGGSE